MQVRNVEKTISESDYESDLISLRILKKNRPSKSVHMNALDE